MNLFSEWLTLVKAEFKNYNLNIFRKDFLASLTVAAVALPLALAFGVASGADAAAGLVTAVISGVLIGALAGSPFLISGPTGAMSAVLIVLAARHGLEGVWIAGILSGIMILVLAIFRLGRIVSLIPAPVISGFTSGIAIIIALGQIDNSLGMSTPVAENIIEKFEFYFSHPITPNYLALCLTAIVMSIMILWPKSKYSKVIPGSLLALIVATLIASILAWDVPTISNIPRSIFLEKRLHFDNIIWKEISSLIIPALSIAALGAIETLLCGAVAGKMTGTRMHSSVELCAQGIGNIVVPFFGGVPTTAAIARTSVNIKSGGITRLVPILHGIILLLVTLILAPIISNIPLAALAGILIVTAWRMNEWHSIKFYFGKKLKHAIASFLITLLATVFLDLTQAIIIGFAISALIFITQMSELQITRQTVDISRMSDTINFIPPNQPISIYHLSGPLFFAAARNLIEKIELQESPNTHIILSMRGVPLIDATGIEILHEVLTRQRQAGSEVLMSGLQPRVQKVMERSDFLSHLGESKVYWSTEQAIASLSL